MYVYYVYNIMLHHFIFVCSIVYIILLCFVFYILFKLSLGILIIISPFLFPAIEINCEMVISQEIDASGTSKLIRVKINVFDTIKGKTQNRTEQ